VDKEFLDEYFGDNKENPISKIEEALKREIEFDNGVGLFNSISGSLIKIKDDGIIDIFVDGDNGIRIDPNNNSINLFTLNEKHHIGNIDLWIQNNLTADIKNKVNIRAGEFNISCSNNNINIGSLNVEELLNTISNMENKINELENEINILKEGNNNG
jgi:hypothetical protein